MPYPLDLLVGVLHCRGRTILTRRQNVTAGCLNFAKSHFAVPDSEVACLWQTFSELPSILPPQQNNPVAAVLFFLTTRGNLVMPREFYATGREMC